VIMTSRVIALGLMPDTGTITNYFAQVRGSHPTPSECSLCPENAKQ
jgi:hypothetical protein